MSQKPGDTQVFMNSNKGARVNLGLVGFLPTVFPTVRENISKKSVHLLYRGCSFSPDSAFDANFIGPVPVTLDLR